MRHFPAITERLAQIAVPVCGPAVQRLTSRLCLELRVPGSAQDAKC